MSIKLKVLTLNCWGVFVPFACAKRKERIQEIGKEVGKGVHDIVFLQEIWSKNDYLLLCNAICPTMPYTHYFHGGIIGSGLCIFSKHMIIETSQFRFSLNGYAHRIFCGDWMGEKSVGLSKIIIQPSGIRVNAYTTHLHAQYSPENTYNSYDEHRCLQSFEVAKFIRDTGEGCDFVVIGGDFNIMPNQIGYRIIRSVAKLDDSWKSQKNWAKAEREEPTCERPDNSLGTSNTHCPEGVRIDYLLHRQNPGTVAECESCDLAMRRIPGMDIPYSDHEGIEATYSICKLPESEHLGKDAPVSGLKTNDEMTKNVSDGVSMLENGREKIRNRRKMWLLNSLFCSLCLFLVIRFQVEQLGRLETQNCKVLQHYRELCPRLEQGMPPNVGGADCEEMVLRLLHPDDDDGLGVIDRACEGSFDLYFYVSEVIKVPIIAILLFSLLHGLVILTKEIVTFTSITEDMKKLIEFSKLSPQ